MQRKIECNEKTVTALRMGGNFHALGRENFCCVRLQRVAGAHFAHVIEEKFPSQVIEKQ